MTMTMTMTLGPAITEAGKAALIEQHRDFNVEHIDWWDCVYDDFVDYASERGFDTTTKSIQFSGFWSQGDGASFTSDIDIPTFIQFHKLEWAYPWIMKLLESGGTVDASVERISHRYSHENTCRATVSAHDDFFYLIDTNGDETREAVLAEWDKLMISDIDQLEKDVEQTRLELCRELYRSLEAEYEHLTSDEAVWESIVANELDREPTEEDDQ
jgi:hypothetical protein